jgi:hypothetical protein
VLLFVIELLVTVLSALLQMVSLLLFAIQLPVTVLSALFSVRLFAF